MIKCRSAVFLLFCKYKVHYKMKNFLCHLSLSKYWKKTVSFSTLSKEICYGFWWIDLIFRLDECSCLDGYLLLSCLQGIICCADTLFKANVIHSLSVMRNSSSFWISNKMKIKESTNNLLNSTMQVWIGIFLCCLLRPVW